MKTLIILKCFFLLLYQHHLFCRALHTRTPSATHRLTSSYVQGTSDIPLITKTVSQCLDKTVERFPDREALVFHQDGIRKTFAQFKEEVSAWFAPQRARREDNCSSRHDGEMKMVSWLSLGVRCVNADLHPVPEQWLTTPPQPTPDGCVLPLSSRSKGGSNMHKVCARYPRVNFHTLKLSLLSDEL